jgi:PPOX class probable F420-dependent enzyme
VDSVEMRERVAAARVARLATLAPGGRPHLVPVCFALHDETLYWAVDQKPKTTSRLQRLRNIVADPRVSLLVDHYVEHWRDLWWVRVDGVARVVDGDADNGRDEAAGALTLLTDKYEQYRVAPPAGPLVAIDITTWQAWP